MVTRSCRDGLAKKKEQPSRIETVREMKAGGVQGIFSPLLPTPLCLVLVSSPGGLAHPHENLVIAALGSSGWPCLGQDWAFHNRKASDGQAIEAGRHRCGYG